MFERPIEMVDLKSQYARIKEDVDRGIQKCIDQATFINGPSVREFQVNLEEYLGVKHVIPCANGTDALQIAMMALDLEEGDEVIVPAFTYVATAEVIALLKLSPVMVDVDLETMNITPELIEKAITPKTKAIVPVHLFGQCCDMEGIMQVANKYGLKVIEDNAQAIGADYQFSSGVKAKSGTIGTIGCTSFFPSKNLGCYGDGGAIMTQEDALAEKMRIIANHGQVVRYYHDFVGVNSRLDSIQAAILDVKLRYLDEYCSARWEVAMAYNKSFEDIDALLVPQTASFTTHVFHQYTMRVQGGQRAALQEHLQKLGIPSMIYYPVPLYKQKAFSQYCAADFSLQNTEILCEEVMSLPIHTEMKPDMLAYIIDGVRSFFLKK